MTTELKMKLENRAGEWGFRLLVIALCVYSFFPVLWLFLTSLKSDAQIIAWPVEYLPSPVTLEQFYEVFARAPFLQFIMNSVFVSAAATVLCVGAATLAAYPLARLDIPGKGVILIGFLLISTFPLISMMVPLFEIFRELGMLNQRITLILPYAIFSMPISIWILTAFFREIPAALEDAARIDGCSNLGALVRVIFPLSAPGVATAAMMAFINSWNEFTLAFSLITERTRYTLPVGITLLRGQYAMPWGLIAAGIVIAIIPLVFLIIVFQKTLIAGLTKGAVKG